MRATEVIATHGNTDFDAFAAMLAARRLYPDAVVCVPGTLNKNVKEFYRLHADELDAVEASRLALDAVRRLIVVETQHASRLGELEQVALDPDVEKAVFDHHTGEPLPEWVAPENAVLSEDGALTTTLVGILAEREIAVSPLEATAFALGIHEDTGSLTYASATQRDADALAWCLRHGARQAEIATYLHVPLAEGERDLLSALLAALESHRVAGIELLVAAVRWPEHVDGISNLAHKIVDLTDCKGLVLLVEMDERVFCVTRSRTPELDAAELARVLGGGGHAQAASAIFRGALDQARETLFAGLDSAVREPLHAKDVMSTPARSVHPDDPVSAAMVACQRYGQSGILVVDDGRLAGTVSREDLDKAISHGLAHAPVKGIMSSKVDTADEETPLGELQRLLSASDDGRVAVLGEDQVVGVVTRSDLLRAAGAREDADAEPAPILADELDRLEHLTEVFDAVSAISEGHDGVYLVGGTVRDILLGEPNFDVDIAVEGDAIALAGSLADALDGRARVHEKFGTAVVLYGDDERVDVVTARTEFYDAPAALPTVEHASIREDLFRRDFTINAMAVSLKGEDRGRLVDPFGGGGIYRPERSASSTTCRSSTTPRASSGPSATRTATGSGWTTTRFGSPAAASRWASSATSRPLASAKSSSRCSRKGTSITPSRDSRSWAPAGRFILTSPPTRRPSTSSTACVSSTIATGSGVPTWRLGFIALARELPADEAFQWLEGLKVRRRDTEQIAAAVTVGPRIVERLRGTVSPAEVVALAEPYAPDAPLYALALADLPAVHDYFERLGDVRLEITGSDVAELGLAESPRVGEVLSELRRRKLNGELDGRESELAAARKLIEAP